MESETYPNKKKVRVDSDGDLEHKYQILLNTFKFITKGGAMTPVYGWISDWFHTYMRGRIRASKYGIFIRGLGPTGTITPCNYFFWLSNWTTHFMAAAAAAGLYRNPTYQRRRWRHVIAVVLLPAAVSSLRWLCQVVHSLPTARLSFDQNN